MSPPLPQPLTPLPNQAGKGGCPAGESESVRCACSPHLSGFLNPGCVTVCECICVHVCAHRQCKTALREAACQGHSPSEIGKGRRVLASAWEPRVQQLEERGVGGCPGEALPPYSLGPPPLYHHSPSGPTSSAPGGFEMRDGRVCPALGNWALPGAEYLGNRVRAVGQEMTSQVSPLQGQLPAETERRRWGGGAGTKGTELGMLRATRGSLALLARENRARCQLWPSCIRPHLQPRITWPQLPKVK